MTAHKFRIGDPVWAKMKGFSPWPGKVSQTSTDYRRIFSCNRIYFVYNLRQAIILVGQPLFLFCFINFHILVTERDKLF